MAWYLSTGTLLLPCHQEPVTGQSGQLTLPLYFYLVIRNQLLVKVGNLRYHILNICYETQP